VRDIVGSL